MHDVERAYVGGERVSNGDLPTFESINPATGDTVADVTIGDAEQVDLAVDAAQAAQPAWAALAPQDRAVALWRWADDLEAHGAELGHTDTLDMGRPIRDSVNDATKSARTARYWAGISDKIWGDQIPVTPGHLSYTVREPLGVCGIILPWNTPVSAFVARVAPAIACGNAVVVKPSEHSPLSAGRLAELATEAGIPAGVVNVVPGDGSTGAALASHPEVGGISFTGSVPTGRAVASAGAPTFKKVVLELGGKAPNIVFGDADLTAAARGSVWGVYSNAGQICCASTRLLVQRSILQEFVARVTALAGRVRVGDPLDATTHMGPLVCSSQFDRVAGYIAAGIDEGATLAFGDREPEPLDGVGLYVQPTLFLDVEPEMRIAKEEIFGPVLSVVPFDDEADALRLAHQVDYGLSANVWTSDGSRALRIASALECGTVWVNTPRLFDPALPFGGYKNSGVGNAYGDGAIEGSTRVKRVSIRYDDAAAVPGWADLGA